MTLRASYTPSQKIQSLRVGTAAAWREGGANCTGQSTVQITDILSVYRSAVHPCVSAAALSAENLKKKKRGKRPFQQLSRGELNLSQSVLLSYFLLPNTWNAPRLLYYMQVFFFWAHSDLHISSMFNTYGPRAPPQQRIKGRDTKVSSKNVPFSTTACLHDGFFHAFLHFSRWCLRSSLLLIPPARAGTYSLMPICLAGINKHM